MICSPLLFDSFFLPKIPSNVHLPNGQTVPIVFTGSIRFSSDIILHNALYFPSFNINLVSALRLTNDNSIGLFFLKSKCILPDLSKWRMIGLAEVQSGLYHLQNLSAQANNEMHTSVVSPSTSLVETCNVNYDIWHFRLGHLPPTKIQFISNLDSSVKATHSHNNICEICPLAKQKRLPFHVSSSQSNKAFQLVHVDIWGLFSIPFYSGYQYFLTIVDD